MKNTLIKACSILGILILVNACGTVPESRSHYIQLVKEKQGSGVGPFKVLVFSKTITQPFDAVFNNIDDKLQGCVPGGYQSTTMRGSSTSTLRVANNDRIEKVAPGKAEVTIQQYHSGTVMQSEGGFYLLAADVQALDADSVRLDFYTAKHYIAIAEAIEQWANGSDKCHGIGGNP